MGEGASVSDRDTTYSRIIEWVFESKYREGERAIDWERDDILKACEALGITRPKNLGDVVYSFRYRTPLPEAVRRKAPPGEDWIIRGTGPARYRFVATALAWVSPTVGMEETKVPDATPGIVAMYALSDEQARLAKLRYNRLVDTFTGVTCYSLQSHLRTNVPGLGQLETDEVYVGLDRRGAHYVFPVQAKGGSDVLSVVQVEQDFAMCQLRLPDLICRPIGAQFISSNHIALFEFVQQDSQVRIASERHYRLVPPDDIKTEDLRLYQVGPP